DLDNAGAMVAADPEHGPLGGAIHEYTPDIGGARQQIVDHLAGRGTETRDLVGEHRAGPRLGALLDCNDVIGRTPRGGHLPLLHAAGFRTNHADGVAAVLGKPQPVLLVDTTATRTRERARGRPDGDFTRFGIAPADVAAAKLQLIKVVLLIARHAVGPDLLAIRRLGWAQIFKFSARQIEPVAGMVLLIVGPHLAVDIGLHRRDH